MQKANNLRVRRRVRRRCTLAAVCLLLSRAGLAQDSGAAQPSSLPTVGGAARTAYLAGAKDLDHDNLAAAERHFARAIQLDPSRKEYGVALELARQHELTALVQQAGKARLTGDAKRADALLEQARAIDPENPLVVEHNASYAAARLQATQPRAVGAGLADRSRLMAEVTPAGWKLPAPLIAGAIELQPNPEPKSLHFRGDTRDVLRQIADAFGIRAVIDESVGSKQMRFDMEGATYAQAMPLAMQMAHAFSVPLDSTSMLLAKSDAANLQRLEPQLEETIFLPGMNPEQINDLATVVRTVFGINKASVQSTLGSIIVRVPEAVLNPLNRTLQELIDSDGEVMLDVKLYELDLTRSRSLGATLPTQAGIYNVQAEATNLVNANQSLVQQAIAQGYIPATASNLQIALALLASGLVQSSLLSSTIGFFGNGLTLTGITESGTVGFNLGLNESDTRTLDDVQMHVGDRQPATFRSGTRYPITSSTYTTGLPTAAAGLGGASINGVSVSSLLSQFSGGSSLSIPQVQYEDLGVTLKATPSIQRSGRISMALEMKIEALAGGSVDGIPILASRQFVSSISVADGETAMLVSNMSRTETAATSGIPGLSELPGFQAPLEANVEKDSSQLVVLITPHVIRRRMNPTSGPPMLMHLAEEGAGGPAAEPEPPPAAAPVPPPVSAPVAPPVAAPNTVRPTSTPLEPIGSPIGSTPPGR